MINLKKFEDMEWEFKSGQDAGSFYFKSPRMNNFWFLYDFEVTCEEDLIKIEKGQYRIRIEKNLYLSFNEVRNNTMKQLELLINKGLPIPPELKIEFTTRIV